MPVKNCFHLCSKNCKSDWHKNMNEYNNINIKYITFQNCEQFQLLLCSLSSLFLNEINTSFWFFTLNHTHRYIILKRTVVVVNIFIRIAETLIEDFADEKEWANRKVYHSIQDILIIFIEEEIIFQLVFLPPL